MPEDGIYDQRYSDLDVQHGEMTLQRWLVSADNLCRLTILKFEAFLQLDGIESIPRMADLVGLQLKEDEVNQLPYVPSLVYPGSDDKPISDFTEDLAHDSKIMIDPEGRVLVTDTGVEMQDLLSIVAEFYLSKDSVSRRKISMRIPYFDRKSLSKGRSNTSGSVGKLKAAEVAPAKRDPNSCSICFHVILARHVCVGRPFPFRPLAIRIPSQLKQSQKRRQGHTAGEEKDLFKRNSFHPCESLLSVLIDKKGKGQTALLSVKKSRSELPDLLIQFSAGIAGTGLVVILSVICNVACGRVPFCSAKLVSTGLSIGLVVLSWAVSKLRDTVIDISRKASK